jgi:DNA invertase Pin-like site-specific DNA recombinase
MIKRNRRVAVYTRVSTDGQTCANQENELRAVAERKGCTVVKVYTDRGISGAKGRDKRPGFDALCKDAVRREFDVVQDLVGFLSEIHAAGVDVQGLDTTTPAGKAMFQMLGVFAEFERSLIRERVMAGLARARKQGTKSGHSFGRPHAAMEGAIRAALVKGDKGMRKIAVELCVATGTVQRVKAEMEARRA